MAKSKNIYSSDEIRKIANSIPNYAKIQANGKPLMVRKSISGDSCLVLGVTKMTDGTPIKPGNQEYLSAEQPLMVNHFKALMKAAKLKGDDGIKEYIVKSGKEYRQYVTWLSKNPQ